ncbi:MAG: tRNA-binding protein [Gammaproteobacteria bacterium]|jgi:tRNA-binding protein|nr:tRNA-binding protein [Gammaproteobacteria bacterium]MDC3315446.1 tRNA-binding protein [Candidatus Thioglobus sp.]|tara:strand:- start:302 stop:649 length:348 start_codon:yes stop_codon:yes gene_type:complete
MGDDMTITWQDFEKVDIRLGTIIKVEDFPEARNPAYILHVDFGSEVGIKKSSSQITDLYNKDQLKDKQVMGVVNFPPKQVGSIMSECLVLGFYRNDNSVVLATNDLPIDNGARLL